ncbi:MAG: hypothetical protein ACOVT5_16635 [Armatimonadaceae bacterium]
MAVIVGAKKSSVNTPLFTIHNELTAAICTPPAGEMTIRIPCRIADISGVFRTPFGSATSPVLGRITNPASHFIRLM